VAGDARIKISVTADTAQAQQGLKQVASDTQTFGSNFKSTFAGVLSAQLVQKAAAAIWDFGKQSVEAYEKAEQNNVRYRDALSRIPGASDAATKSLEGQAKALSKLTVYSAGQTKQAQASLAQYGLTADQIKQLTPLVQDFAARTGTDLPTAAGQVGKALLGQGRALKQVGLDFKDTGSVAGNFAEITAGLQGKVGGLAEKMGETSAGKMQIMKNQITALQVALGSMLVPAIEKVVSVLMPLVGWISKNTSWLLPLAAGVVAVVGALKLWAIVQAALNAVMAANPIVLIILAVAALGVAIYELVTHWSAVWKAIKDAASAVWDWIKSNWPLIVEILAGPIGIAVGLIIKYWSQITDGLKAAWNWISGVWSTVAGYLMAPFVTFAGWMTTAWGVVQGALQAVWNWVTANWPLLVGALLGPFGLAVAWVVTNWHTVTDALAAAWNWVVSVWSTLVGYLIAPFQAAWGVIVGVANAIGAAISAAFNWIVGVWSTLVGYLIAPFQAAWGVIVGVANAIAGFVVGVVGRIASGWANIFGILIGPFQSAWGVISGILNGLIGFIAGIPGRVASAVAGVFGALTGPFTAAVNFIKGILSDLWGFVSSTMGNVSKIVTGGISAAKGVYNGFARVWNSIQITLPKVHIPLGPTLGGETIGLPDLPMMQKGAYLTRATLMVAGEAGGEYVLPEAKLARLIRANGGGGPALHIENATFGGDADLNLFARRLAWQIQTRQA
jgi:phage-related protein